MSASTLDQALGTKGRRGAEANQTLEFVHLSASWHKGSPVWGVGGLCISLCFTHA